MQGETWTWAVRGSPLVQEKYQEENVCDKRQQQQQQQQQQQLFLCMPIYAAN
jgi:hypothetical protein